MCYKIQHLQSRVQSLVPTCSTITVLPSARQNVTLVTLLSDLNTEIETAVLNYIIKHYKTWHTLQQMREF